MTHVDEAAVAPLPARFGEPETLEWEGEISEREHSLATFNPHRTHDATLFIFNGDRPALIREQGFKPESWRPPPRRYPPRLRVEERHDLRDRRDPRTRPVPRFLPHRLFTVAVDQDRAHAGPLRACQLVVRTV